MRTTTTVVDDCLVDRADGRVVRAPDGTPLRAVAHDNEDFHSAAFAPRKRRWPGIVAAGVLGAGLAALAVSSFYDPRTVGEKLDATVAATQQSVQSKVDDVKDGANQVAQGVSSGGANVTERAALALNDAGITAAVKTALAADPKLSAVKIDVTTQGGVVSLDGPAPDGKSRERAEVLAAAPSGVVRVENRLVVPSGEPITQ